MSYLAITFACAALAVALVAIWTVAEMSKKTLNKVTTELRGQTGAMWKSINQYEHGIKTLSERNLELHHEIEDLRLALTEAVKQNELLSARLDTVAQAQVEIATSKLSVAKKDEPIVIKNRMLS